MTFAGSPLYMSPEVFAMQPHNEKIDIWGLGVCLYYMLTDTFPFISNNYHELEEKVLFHNVIFPKKMNLSEDVKDLIKKMLRKDYNQRISIDEIRNHSWLLDFSRKENIKRYRRTMKTSNNQH